MSLQASSSALRPRTIVHPGRFNPVRISSMHSRSARHFRLLLAPGETLHDAIVAPLAALAVKSASMTILGGSFTMLEYCVARPDASHHTVIAYSPPIEAGPSMMIFGNATLGRSLAGTPLVHCHAAFRTMAGPVKGGHILTGSSVIGHDPIAVLVTSLDEFDLQQAFDPETEIPLLQPCERTA